MFAETGPDFSAEVCPGAAIGDLAPEAISAFRGRWGSKTRDERKTRWTDEQTLANAELLLEGRVTYAALILFGSRAALGRWLAQAELVFEYRSSEASGPAADRDEYREGFFLWHEAIWNKINLRNDRQSYQDGLFRVELPTFDDTAQLGGRRLLSVADGEDRQAFGEDRLRRPRAPRLRHRGRTAREDHRLGIEARKPILRLRERHDLAIDASLAHAPGDELRHLAAEVDDEDVLGHGVSGREHRDQRR